MRFLLGFVPVACVACSSADEVSVSVDEPDAGRVPSPADAGDDGLGPRGFLDPDLPPHNIFGGISWSVVDQRVIVDDPPEGSVEAVASCMGRYGDAIVRHADANRVSRAAVVATAITESNCTNPEGSSDGLSSGPMQVTGSTCAEVASLPSAECKARMHAEVGFSFEVGVRYIASRYQRNQHENDPPKIAAAYNAGSLRSTTRNRWHMVVTGNHLERFVGAYNAYRAWEGLDGERKVALAAQVARAAAPFFEGEHAPTMESLPRAAAPGQVYFVGDWARRDGAFVQFRDGRWQR